MSLIASYKASRVIESIENYCVADTPLEISESHNYPSYWKNDSLFSDKEFWRQILANPDAVWDRIFFLYKCTVCTWVARIPGLFWVPGSEKMRELAENEIAFRTEDWTQYHPLGKSEKVMGGVGTLLFPPDNKGYRLITLTFNCNASTGIPALISPEVSEVFNLKDGVILSIQNVKWQKMSLEWAQRFPSTSSIPRGYLVIDNPTSIRIEAREKQYVEFHPFSLMEYEYKGALLYDYVYVTTDTLRKDYRSQLVSFFNDYRNKDGRYGRYLLACDINEPLFEADYYSPAEMRNAYHSGQLNLLEERIRKQTFGEQTIEELASVIPRKYRTPTDIRSLAGRIDISPALLDDNNAARMAIHLIHLCIERKKIEELIDRMAVESAGLFQ